MSTPTSSPHDRATVRDLYWTAVYLQHLATTVRNTSTEHGVSLIPAELITELADTATRNYQHAETTTQHLTSILTPSEQR